MISTYATAAFWLALAGFLTLYGARLIGRVGSKAGV